MDRPAKRMKSSTSSNSLRDELKYNPGFGNLVCSEALEGALPLGQNNPQSCPYGLYAEQLSGTAFTKPRKENARVWMYRIRPSVQHEHMIAAPDLNPAFGAPDTLKLSADPNQMRWMPVDVPERRHDFAQGLKTYGACGDPAMNTVCAYTTIRRMLQWGDSCMLNADGDF